MALDFEKLSPHLRDTLLSLKHMSPMQRFNELSRPRFELQWQTLAFRYGIEKLEAQGWIISDNEILNPKSKSSPLINTDDTDQGRSPSSRVIADIARDRETENPDLPLMNTDDTDRQQSEGSPQRTQRTQSQATEENPELKQVEEQVSAGLEKMAEAAAMETERLPMPENQNDKDAVRRRDDEIWRRACEYTEHTLRPRIEADIRRQVGAPMQWEPPEDRAEYHRRQLAKLTKADAAPRCEHIYTDGTMCGSPKLKNGLWCYAHERMKAVRVTRLRLLPMEDGNSIMLNLMEIQRALVEGEISERTAGLLMYNQQLGLIALKGITFRETDVGAMVTVLPQRTQRTRRRRRIARNAKTAKHSKLKGKGLPQRPASMEHRKTKISPLMNTDDTDQRDFKKSNAAQPRHRATKPTAKGASTPVRATSARSGDPRGCATQASPVNPGDERAKSFRFGDGGVNGGGRGAEIAGSAAIARDRRDRKGKTDYAGQR